MKRLRRKITFLCALALGAVLPGEGVHAQDITALFNEGNQLYQQEQYEAALGKYQSILDSGYESGELYFNIGNAYYKLNNKGKALLNYERARIFLPEDDDLLTNIDLVTLSLTDRIVSIPDVFYVRYWNAFRRSLGIPAWTSLFFAAWYFVALNVILLMFVRQRQTKKILKTGVIVGGIVIVVAAAVFVSHQLMDRRGADGIVMQAEERVFSSPSETGTEVFLIHEGTKVHITRAKGKWIEIRLADGKVGWIEKKSVEVI